MEDKIVEELGLDGILADFRSFCRFEDNLDEDIVFETDRVLIENSYFDIRTILTYFQNSFFHSFFQSRIFDVLDRFKKENYVGDKEEFSSVFSLCRNCFSVGKFFTKYVDDIFFDEKRKARVFELVDFSDLSGVERVISKYFTNSGELRDDIPKLLEVDRAIELEKESLNRLISSMLASNSEFLQNSNATFRNGRTVLPLKSNYKNRIEGIIHDSSSSGATLFVEPYEFVEKNNSISTLNSKKLKIIREIFSEISRNIRSNYSLLYENSLKLQVLDRAYSRAEFIFKNGRAIPDIDDSKIDLKKVKHHELGEKAVALDIFIDRLTVISGANAGGKSVALKTIGISSVLFQMGLGVLCLENSHLPVFSEILVDFGDEQSIENELSTYSAHLKRLSGFCKRSCKSSLILLDEFASGTDPIEGGALGNAILERLLTNGSLVVLTTHNTIIKDFALHHSNAQNFSMEFDSKRLVPTFKILRDSVGESHAIAIGKKIGFDTEIIDSANSFLEKKLSDSAKLLRDINKKSEEFVLLKKELDDREVLINSRESEIIKREALLKRSELAVKREMKVELAEFIRESRESLKKIKKSNGKEFNRASDSLVASLNGKLSELKADVDRGEEFVLSENNYIFEDGMSVKVGKFQKRGTLIRKKGSKKWLVAIDSIKMEIDEVDLVPVMNEDYKKRERVAHSYSLSKSKLEIDLRGLILEDAISVLEKQLDSAIVGGLREFSIIHGKGNGVLSAGVHNYLKNYKNILEYKFAKPEEGGFGKTIVVLKD